MRPIDADALMEQPVWFCGGWVGDSYAEGYMDALDKVEETVKSAPTIDAIPQWVPCEVGLPNDRSWYLGIFREAGTGWINPIPFICDYIGHDTGVTTLDYWVLKDHEDDREFGFDYYRNMECVAWMPLPETYDGERENDKEVSDQNG